MPELKTKYGVDFVLFDGEELVYDGQRDPYFLGSEHFAREYVANPPAHRYRCGVLLDMVGDAQPADLPRDQQHAHAADAAARQRHLGRRPRAWACASSLPRPRHEVRDDHLALNKIAQHSHDRHHRLRLSHHPRPRLLAHDAGRARKVLRPVAGQGRLGAAGVGEAREVMFGAE